MNSDKNVRRVKIPTDERFDKFLEKLRQYPYKKKNIVPFSVVNQFAGSRLKYTRKETAQLIDQLATEGVIDIVQGWGVRFTKTSNDTTPTKAGAGSP